MVKLLFFLFLVFSSFAQAAFTPTALVNDGAGNPIGSVTNGGVANGSNFLETIVYPITFTTPAYTSSTGTVNLDMLSGTTNGWYDAAAFNNMAITIYTTTTVTGGVITFEQTDDKTNDASGITMNLQDSSVLTQTNVTSLTLAASTIKRYQAPIQKRYVRFRLSTAFAGTGSVGATVIFKNGPYIPLVTSVAQATAGSLNSTATIASGTITSVTSSQTAIPGLINDVASAALTTTTTTATLTPTFGSSYQVQIPVTAVTGTSPTLDVEVQESDDTGTNWYAVYDFPRITATGAYRSPVIKMTGNRIRYVQTVGGTTPSFTRAVNRLQSSSNAPVLRSMVDRTIVPNTGSSTSAVINVDGCVSFSYGVSDTSASSPATFDLQLSPDGVTYESQGLTVTPASGALATIQGVPLISKFAKIIVTSAGSSEVLNYAWLECVGQ